MRTDINTNRHATWYFFRVQNTRKGVNYRFNINNCEKKNSNYLTGMKPLVYSLKANKGWSRGGKNIFYFANDQKNTLSFEFEFDHDNDTVFFAYSFPYTYSQLQVKMNDILSNPRLKMIVGKKLLTRSLNGNECNMLIVTDFSGSDMEIATREAIFIAARVHPGETNCQFVMEGLLDFLLSNDKRAKFLRSNFVFKIIPMLNIDGVVVGNTRCNIIGLDLNRQYRNPEGECPEIRALCNEINHTLQSRRVCMFFDIHGHSQNKNCFIFGCNNNSNQSKIMLERIFPLILHKNIDSFYFDSCSFSIEKTKSSTGRISIFEVFDITDSFTFETSMCGPSVGSKKGYHFTIQDLVQVGHQLGECLYKYQCETDEVQNSVDQLREMYPTIDHLIS